jgi:hypothetical protein
MTQDQDKVKSTTPRKAEVKWNTFPNELLSEYEDTKQSFEGKIGYVLAFTTIDNEFEWYHSLSRKEMMHMISEFVHWKVTGKDTREIYGSYFNEKPVYINLSIGVESVLVENMDMK